MYSLATFVVLLFATTTASASTTDPTGRAPKSNAELKAAIANLLKVSDFECSNGPHGPIGDWDVSGVTDMSTLFVDSNGNAIPGHSKFNADISEWDVSSATDMNRMFYQARAFNSDVSKWDVSSVTNMKYMFASATAFHGGDMSKWHVSRVTDMSQMFDRASSFNGDLSNWDVSIVTNTFAMFVYASSFNGDVSKWDVSRVTKMTWMFGHASNFNSDISKWDVSRVTNMDAVLYETYSFTHTLCGAWKTSKASKKGMLQGSQGKLCAVAPTEMAKQIDRAKTSLDINALQRQQRGYYGNTALETRQVDYILRLPAKNLSRSEFERRFEARDRPLIITGAQANWSATSEWTLEKLLKRFGDAEVHDIDGDAFCEEEKNAVRRFDAFVNYTRHQKDDSPLYLFEKLDGRSSMHTSLMRDYEKPYFAPSNLFSIGDPNLKSVPVYRWFCVGPKRSGSSVHVDPLGTSAWNALIKGRKRWVLFSPTTPEEVARGEQYLKDGDDAFSYFLNVLPKIRQDNSRREGMQMYEFIQYPGDTIFVPGGWWHAVVNLDDTVAVTENYWSSGNFDKVWRELRMEGENYSSTWYSYLKKLKPNLSRRVDELNRHDGFDMNASKK